MHVLNWRKIPIDREIGEVGKDDMMDADNGIQCRGLGCPINLPVGCARLLGLPPFSCTRRTCPSIDRER